MATMPFTPDSPTVMPAVLDGSSDQTVADTILMTLRAHRDDKPNGFDELEIMALHPSLKLLALRRAVHSLVDQGLVMTLHDGGSKSRITLS